MIFGLILMQRCSVTQLVMTRFIFLKKSLKSFYFPKGIATRESKFGTVKTEKFSMDDVGCNGSEKSLLDCKYDNEEEEDCKAHEGAGVLCYNNSDSAFQHLFSFLINNSTNQISLL